MALSKPAKEYDFVEPLTREFDCPICHCILTEPFLTKCCGNHFCEACIFKAREEEGNQCPLCKGEPDGMVSKYLKRLIHQSEVNCSQKAMGCEWVGQLGEMKDHLSIGKQQGDCQYVAVECPLFCGKEITRGALEVHINDECDHRQSTCKRCGFSSTLEVISTQHDSNCPSFPVPCPNDCSSQVYLRREIDGHFAVCPDQEVACTYGSMGCKEMMKRRLLQQHIETSVLQHQSLMCEALAAQNEAIASLKNDKEQFEARENQLKNEVDTLKQNLTQIRLESQQVGYWVSGFKLMADELKRHDWFTYLNSMSELATSLPNATSPVILKIPDFRYKQGLDKLSKCGKGSCSNCFYTHANGYKLCLSLNTYGFSSGRGTHLSVYTSIQPGEYDNHLIWPLTATVTVTLLNQLGNARHHTLSWSYRNSPVNVASRIYDQMSTARCGCHSFMLLSALDAKSNVAYLVRNQLFFEVSVNF